MFTITTTLTHTAAGTPKIVARGLGKQKTTNYDHGKSHDRNHGEAAGNLVLHLNKTKVLQGSEVKAMSLRIYDGLATHTTENGAKHVFKV